MDIDITKISNDKLFKIIFLLQVNVAADIHEGIDDVGNNLNIQEKQVQ